MKQIRSRVAKGPELRFHCDESKRAKCFSRALKIKLEQASARIKSDDCAALRITKDRREMAKEISREACIMDRRWLRVDATVTSVRIKVSVTFSLQPSFLSSFFFFRAPKRRKVVRCSAMFSIPVNNFESNRGTKEEKG